MTLLLGTLAAGTLVVGTVGDTVQERTWLSSVRGTWTLANWTPNSGAGPIQVGVAHPDYTAAEIEEWIESTGSWDEGDLVQQEIAKRKIRRVGTFDMAGISAAVESAVLNDGRPVTTKCGWILNQGVSLDVWAYNNGSAAVATTDPPVRFFGHANLWPK